MWTEILIATIVILVIWSFWLIYNFRGWKRELLLILKKNSSIVNTSVGPVEYVLVGNGPVIVAIHGVLGGYDQALFAIREFVDQGFSILAFSRPGYLRTPLSAGDTFEKQADVIAALLDSLEIEKAAIIGSSAGGPTALHFAPEHHDSTLDLCLICAVSKQYIAEDTRGLSILKRVLGSKTSLDFGAWLFDILTRYRPSYSLKQMFKENAILEPKQVGDCVQNVMSHPSQVEWYKEFVRTACPLSPRKIGHDNDFEQLAQVNIPEIGNIGVPTLIIHGTVDRVVPFSHAEFASTIPNSTLYDLQDIGHIVWFGRHVDQMKRTILEFVAKNC